MTSLPTFAKSIGLDLIVRPGGEVVLIELQSHFGRSGLLTLFQSAGKRHRQTTRRLRNSYGTSQDLFKSLRRICSSKILTWRHLNRFQPSSYVYSRWSEGARSWLEGLQGEYVLFKPPRGSCGRGILVFRKEELPGRMNSVLLTSSVLLQEYIESRHLLDDAGRPHMGCIRHIVHVFGDASAIGFVHLPSYWRVAAAPFEGRPPREAFTANISTGAYPLPVEGAEAQSVRDTSEEILRELLEPLLAAKSLAVRSSEYVSAAGDLLPSPGGAVDIRTTLR